MTTGTRQSGFTLLEMMIAIVLSSLLLGAVFAVQETATTSFQSCLAENKVTKDARDGIDSIKRELRSCLSTSISWNAWTGDPLTPLLEFQQAVSFDSANGLTRWGADDEVGGKIEYVVVGTDLIRRVRSATNAIISESTLVREIDLNPDANLDPVELAWDDTTNLVRVVIRRAVKMNGKIVKRNLDTMVYVDPVFKF